MPLLFILYIKDLPQNTKNTSPSTFAGDTKVNGKVDSKSKEEFTKLDLDALECWSDIWQLKFMCFTLF